MIKYEKTVETRAAKLEEAEEMSKQHITAVLNLLESESDEHWWTNRNPIPNTNNFRNSLAPLINKLFDQIKDAMSKAPFNVKSDEYRIDNIYLFSAPVSSERVEPFHILLEGELLEKKKNAKKVTIGDPFGGDDDGWREPRAIGTKG